MIDICLEEFIFVLLVRICVINLFFEIKKNLLCIDFGGIFFFVGIICVEIFVIEFGFMLNIWNRGFEFSGGIFVVFDEKVGLVLVLVDWVFVFFVCKR